VDIRGSEQGGRFRLPPFRDAVRARFQNFSLSFLQKFINLSKGTSNKFWSKSCVCQETAEVMCKCAKRGPSTTWMCR